MKQIWVTLTIACLAITGTTRADTWGRISRNSYVSQTQKAGPVQGPAGESPIIQAPSAISSAPMNYDGYPFTNRCGGGSGCCNDAWAGYSRSCGCGHGLGLFAHKHGCGLQGSACGSCGCGSLGGCFNSFSGGSCCNTCGCGSGHGHWGHHLGHKLHALGGGCGHFHKWCSLRSLCGFGCDTGCSTCDSAGITGGCSSCAGQVQHHGHIQNGKGQFVNPPAPPVEPTPAADELPPAPENVEKSAFRPSKLSSYQFRSGF